MSPASSFLRATIACALIAATAHADAPSFQRDVRPILSRYCFACHGPDEESRQAKLRLDTFAGATNDLGGQRAIAPGAPEASELLRRVAAFDPAERMPPPESGKTLTREEVDTLRRWIAAGAEYERHWAFVAPARPSLPEVSDPSWPRGAIDRFVLARLDAAGLRPSPPADRYTLIRRLYLDLLGVPPTPAEADAFVRDSHPDAYEKLVDGLLARPEYGERWARRWLDLARYSDTNGYEKDRPRSMWPYRDWVIHAFLRDAPFDEFTIDQLAGDMVERGSLEQRVATGFHRNTMLNEEGGIDPLEYRYYAMVDRVATTGTTWLGLTLGCAQCHTHKYDPISQTDYYRFFALLNNADEPDLSVPDATTRERQREIDSEIATREAELEAAFPPAPGASSGDESARRAHFDAKFSTWLESEEKRAAPWEILRPHAMVSNLARLEVLPDGSIFASGDATKRDVYTFRVQLATLPKPLTALRLEVLPDPRLPDGGPGRAYYEGRKGDFFLSELRASVDGRPAPFSRGTKSYGKISIGSGSADARNVFDGEGSTGWSTSGRAGEAHRLVLQFDRPIESGDELSLELLFERHFVASLGRFRFAVTSSRSDVAATTTPPEIEAILARDASTRTDDERARLRRQFVRVSPDLAEARTAIDELRKRRPRLPTTLVLEERPPDHPRPTFRHHRGEFLSPRERVRPGVPDVLPPLASSRPPDRLALAEWLVSRRHPLTHRVTVNRNWQYFFGAGLVRSSDDFGTQSDPPTHPELLDWLAVELVESGWSIKALHREIVLSATYRQSSRVSPELLERDPENRLLARGARFRVDGEVVRDIALRASDLLVSAIGGPSVRPPQPASVTAVAYGGKAWSASKGADRFRRSLYTFSKRTAPFAAYLTFDAPSGEQCVSRRDRSNSPLQALTLLNDEMFLEFARALANSCATAESPRDRAIAIFRRALTRPPTARELESILEYHARQRARFEADELDAEKIAGDGDASASLAAWVLVARVVLNLDETITRE